ncbi:MAG TPA: hypothetical protein ENJ56_05880, partial [Anaerolineae bacterium]|nr:hypothetical protein [Anaerolineae bacterium]
TISATYANITKSISIDTVATNLERIIIAPGTTSLTTGATLALRATAIFSDNTSTDITNLGRWTSDNLAVLSVSNGGDKQGIVSAIDEGNATIQISYLDVSSQIGLSVSPATLRSISISPQNISLPGNTELDLTATGIYSDGQSRDITQAVLWSSDAPEIASISNTVGKSGNLRAVTTGTTTISASLADLSSSILIEVTDDTIKGLNILFTGESNLAANSQRLLSAIGNYASGATQDLTQQVKWQTSNSEICTISSAATAETAGILTTLASGLCVATASFGEVSSTVLLTVSTAKLEAITLSPTEISLAKGNQQALTVIGQYSDASTQDLTGQVSWQYSSNVSIDKNGILKALSAGNSTIQASLQGFSDEINVEISSASLENIRISPDPLVINEGTSAQLQATGFYSDDSSQDITHTVTWESTDERVASVSNATDYAGRIDALSTGNTSISAKLDGVLATLNATVELNPTAPKSLALSATPYVIRNNGTDQSTISINVLATDNSTLVADGTRINLSIINGSATLDKNFATINAGKAEFSLTSTTKALITIKATVEGTDISNYVSVYSTDNFAEIIAKGVLLQAKVIDDIIQPGSIFGLAIANYANRSFNLNAFKLGTENNLIYSTTAPEDLNNNVLGAGQYILRGWVTEQERENSFWVAYFLQDPVTGVEFNVGIVFTLPSNN